MDWIARLEKIADGEIAMHDIPFIAALIFIAAIVCIGEIACAFWFIGILVAVLISGPSVLLYLIPCVLIFSLCTAIIIYAVAKFDEY